MPTGYTAALYDGKPQTFEEFAMSCARAFGALVTMRDDPADAEIPDEFAPSSYHEEAAQRAHDRVTWLLSLSEDEAAAQARAEFEAEKRRREESRKRRAGMRERYEAMLAEVRDWKPPTAEHVGLRNFMVQQLEESIWFDTEGYESIEGEPEQLTGAAWLEAERDRAIRDSQYHEAEHAKEVERAQSRTAWVRELRESLGAAV